MCNLCLKFQDICILKMYSFVFFQNSGFTLFRPKGVANVLKTLTRSLKKL